MTSYITCIDCGKEVERTGNNQKWCPECSNRARLERMSEYSRRHQAEYYAKNHQSISERARRWQMENPALKRRTYLRTRERDASIDAKRSGLLWSSHEDAVLLSWTGGSRELAAALGRTVESVKYRRWALRKRAAEQAANNKEVNP